MRCGMKAREEMTVRIPSGAITFASASVSRWSIVKGRFTGVLPARKSPRLMTDDIGPGGRRMPMRSPGSEG